MSRFLRISLIIGLFASNILFAHQRSESFSKWIIEENDLYLIPSDGRVNMLEKAKANQ